MIDTKRSTRGTIIKVLKYDENQSFKKITSTKEGTTEARQKHNRKRNRNNSQKIKQSKSKRNRNNSQKRK